MLICNTLYLKVFSLLLIITKYVITTSTDSSCSLNNHINITDGSYQVEVPVISVYNTSHYKPTHLLSSQCYTGHSPISADITFRMAYIKSDGDQLVSPVHTIISIRFIVPENSNTDLNTSQTANISINGDLKYIFRNAQIDEPSFVYNSFVSDKPTTRTIRVVMKGVHVVMSMMAQEQRVIDTCDDTSRTCGSASPLSLFDWLTCLPKEWKCNHVSECLSGFDEKDCQNNFQFCQNNFQCCDMSTHMCRCRTSPENCLPFPGKHQVMELNGRTGVRMDPIRRNRTEPVGFDLRNNLIIPFEATLTWPSSSTTTTWKLTYQCWNITSDDSVIVSGQKVASMLPSWQTYSVSSNIIPQIKIRLTTPYSCATFSSEFRTEVPRGAQPCHSEYIRSCHYKDLCFSSVQHCNGILDCTNGEDEVGCGASQAHKNVCNKDQIMCPPDKLSKINCYTKHQRCDGESTCGDRADESDCDSTLCGTHNGTYLCPEKKCILESWKCDGTQDCEGGIDEKDCARTTLNVITAAVIGSLACGILIVIAAGCSCRLYSHRLYESMQASSRYESPMTVIQNELLRRAAPPPYQEAMNRSRPFEEVRAEYLAQMRAAEDSSSQNPDTGSIASSSMPVTLGPDGEPKDEEGPELQPSDAQLVNINNTTLIPKSDDEEETQSQSETTLNLNQSGVEMEVITGSRRRRASTSSDVSILSRDSDDAPLI